MATSPTISDAPQPPAIAATVHCAHCGLDVPPQLLDVAGRPSFCCGGCRAVYQVLHELGLEGFYRLREMSDTAAQPARVSERTFSEFDDPVFLDKFSHERDDGSRRIELLIEGMHCAACVWLLEKLPQLVPGALSARVGFARARLTLTWNPRATPLSAIVRQIDRLGYTPHPARGTAADRVRRRDDREFLVRIGAAGVAFGNVMLLAVALYGAGASGIDAGIERTFRWASMLLGVFSLAWPGRVFLRGAINALRMRTPHMDLPIALGLLVGTAAGVVNTIRDHGEIYFDSLTALIFLLLIGRFIQHRQQRSASDSIELLTSLTPLTARRIEGDAVREVPVDALQPQDIVEIRAGDCIPADGRIERGITEIDQSLLTGETQPIRVAAGDAVCAGAVNLLAPVQLRVDAVGASSRVGRLMGLVESSALARPPIVQLADRIAGWFVVAVLVLAAITLAIWLWINPGRAADHTVAVLIVACPCALGLATPLTLAVALGRAAQRGILIKSGASIERLARPGRLWLDKTGTITVGRPAVVRFFGDERVQPLVAAMERHSNHPTAQALVRAYGESRTSLPTAREVSSRSNGVHGWVSDAELWVGSLDFVQREGNAKFGDAVDASRLERIYAEGLTPVAVARAGRIVALIGVGDAIRPEAKDAVSALRRAGWRVGILSGDEEHAVRRIADAVHVEAEAARPGVSPEEKLAIVKEDAGAGVVMVGDGVNDAAALAAADVGIAVHGGAEASLAAADVYLSRAGLAPLLELIHASHRALGVIRLNFCVSLTYNALAVSLAISGLLGPLLAAILMPISSFSVLAVSLSMRTFEGRPCR